MFSKKFLFACIFVAAFSIWTKYSSHNYYSCPDFGSYLWASSNPKCVFNPDLTSNTSEVIERYLKISETHRIKTQDDYILTVFRIPQKFPKNVIILQHCFLCSSKIWVSQQNNSAAFYFWRKGYDVWIGDFRGHSNSKHKTWLKSSPKFWNYTLTELGYFDNQAMIDYIVKKNNGTKVYYMGYSMGGTVGLIYASTRPKESAKNLRGMVLIAAPVHPKTASSAFYPLGQVLEFLDPVHSFFGIYSTNAWYIHLLKSFINLIGLKQFISHVLSPIMGSATMQLDPRYVNDAIALDGSRMSAQIFYHFGQLPQGFQKYDYGKAKNVAIYGSEKPPVYSLENIQIPIVLVSGSHDSLTTPEDTKVIENRLPKEVTKYGSIKVEGYNHMEFLHAVNRDKDVLDKVLEKLELMT